MTIRDLSADKARSVATDCVKNSIEFFIDRHLHWITDVYPDTLIKKTTLKAVIERVFTRYHMRNIPDGIISAIISLLYTDIINDIISEVNLPTWDYITVRFDKNVLVLSNYGDYRIMEYMKRYGHRQSFN